MGDRGTVFKDNKNQPCGLFTGLWIRIRMDPAFMFLLDLDPDPREKKYQTKTEKCKKIGKNCNFIQIFKIFIRLFFTNLLYLDPDLHF